MKARNRYLKIVEWSEEDECYIGSVPGWIGKCCHGDDEAEVYKQLCGVVDEWIELYKGDDRPLPPPTARSYSGKFILRVGADLHRMLALRALAEGESLNTFVVRSLKSAFSGRQAGSH